MSDATIGDWSGACLGWDHIPGDDIPMKIYPTEPTEFRPADEREASRFQPETHRKLRELNRATMAVTCRETDVILGTVVPSPAQAEWDREVRRRWLRVERLMLEFDEDRCVPDWNDTSPSWWRCFEHDEHRWRTSASNRWRRGSRCPYCTKRGASSNAESSLFSSLAPKLADLERTARVPRLDRRKGERCQWTIDMLARGRWNVALEYDGAYWHRGREFYDVRKTRDLLAQGFAVIRIREHPLKALDVSHSRLAQIISPADPHKTGFAEWAERVAAQVTDVLSAWEGQPCDAQI